MSSKSSNKVIAKNTIMLYFRMMITMAVGLYTSRVILLNLGVDDFGVYQTVGGVVGMLSFVSGALSVGSSRFLTYEMGTGDLNKLGRTFSSVLIAHIALVVLIAFVAETVGLQFVYHKLVVAPDRMNAAVWAYHLSVLASVFTILIVPYNACIIAHEKMNIYAYVSIVEVIAKLLIAFAVSLGNFDKLKLYATLLCLVNVGLFFFYGGFCLKKFSECRSKLSWDKKIMKGVLSYSGWNLFANTAITLNNQGAVVLVNMFFSPGVVAARAVANQVNMAANQFINNFRMAANPQIVKRYAAGDYEGSKSLLLTSTKFSYYLMLLLAVPIFYLAEPILRVWLGVVPEYATIFLQLMIVTSLFQVFDTSFYTALYAKGQIKENALISPSLGFVMFPIVYLLFKLGFSPVSLAVCHLVMYAVVGVVVKPILIIKIVNYRLSDVISVFIPCLGVTIASVVLPSVLYYYKSVFGGGGIIYFVVMALVCFVSVLSSAWFLGIDSSMKKIVMGFLKRKFNR